MKVRSKRSSGLGSCTFCGPYSIPAGQVSIHIKIDDVTGREFSFCLGCVAKLRALTALDPEILPDRGEWVPVVVLPKSS